MSARYLMLAEGYSADPHHGKTMRGVVRYRRQDVVAVLDSQRPGESYEGIPIVGSVDEALPHGPDRALIGVAPTGGRLPDFWQGIVLACIAAGLDVESGLHTFLTDDPVLVEAAARRGVELRDLRRPPAGLSVPTGENLTHGATVVHTVGSDCAIGKMTMGLELDREAQRRGIRSVFVPTGQTGIAIEGWGISVDAVIADFVAGAAERLVVEGSARGDLLWVEGQGAIVHPLYSGVTLGLLHGCAPHALILCHMAGTTHIEDLPDHPILPLPQLRRLYEDVSLPARRAPVVALALNTRTLDEAAARRAIAQAEDEVGLPADDPVRFGAGKLVDATLTAIGRA